MLNSSLNPWRYAASLYPHNQSTAFYVYLFKQKSSSSSLYECIERIQSPSFKLTSSKKQSTNDSLINNSSISSSSSSSSVADTTKRIKVKAEIIPTKMNKKEMKRKRKTYDYEGEDEDEDEETELLLTLNKPNRKVEREEIQIQQQQQQQENKIIIQKPKANNLINMKEEDQEELLNIHQHQIEELAKQQQQQQQLLLNFEMNKNNNLELKNENNNNISHSFYPAILSPLSIPQQQQQQQSQQQTCQLEDDYLLPSEIIQSINQSSIPSPPSSTQPNMSLYNCDDELNVLNRCDYNTSLSTIYLSPCHSPTLRYLNSTTSTTTTTTPVYNITSNNNLNKETHNCCADLMYNDSSEPLPPDDDNNNNDIFENKYTYTEQQPLNQHQQQQLFSSFFINEPPPPQIIHPPLTPSPPPTLNSSNQNSDIYVIRNDNFKPSAIINNEIPHIGEPLSPPEILNKQNHQSNEEEEEELHNKEYLLKSCFDTIIPLKKRKYNENIESDDKTIVTAHYDIIEQELCKIFESQKFNRNTLCDREEIDRVGRILSKENNPLIRPAFVQLDSKGQMKYFNPRTSNDLEFITPNTSFSS